MSSIWGRTGAKRARFDVDIVLLRLRDEYINRCICKQDFPLAVVLQHQLYAHFTNRTLVDRRVEQLIESGRLRAVQMGGAEDETALVDFEVINEKTLFFIIFSKGLALYSNYRAAYIYIYVLKIYIKSLLPLLTEKQSKPVTTFCLTVLLHRNTKNIVYHQPRISHS